MRKYLLSTILAICCTLTLVAQQKIVGSVKDGKGSPLAGATVQEKGAAGNSSQSGSDGSFSITLKGGSKVLLVSFVGYKDETVSITGAEPLIVVMQEAPQATQEVVVVGYATQRKVNLTGSVASVGADRLEDRPVTGVTNALAGTVSGVTIVTNNGQPGRDAGKINIRGIGTLNNSDPMIVIDGIIATPNDLNSINPNDIDNISVLKDAASSSIYGSRAAGGVMLITTKKGKKGTAQVTYSTYFGKQKITFLPEYLPSWQAATLFNQARLNEGASAPYSQADIDGFKNGVDRNKYPNTDWLGLFWDGSGNQQNHYLGVSGGNDKTQYLFSLGYFDQKGLVNKTNTKRYTSRFNITTKINNWLSANANIAYTFQPTEEPRSSLPADASFGQIIRQVNRISPIIPDRFANGAYGRISDGNPLAWVNSPSYNRLNAHTVLGMLGADINPMSGLHIRPSLSYRLLLNQNKSFVSSIQYYNADSSLNGLANTSNSTDHYDNNMTLMPQLVVDYGVKVGNHNIKVLAGYSQEYTKYYQLEGSRRNFLNNSLGNLSVAPTDGATSDATSYERALRSYFGRVNYDFMGKYLLEANIRADASSVFAPDKRWGYFPSFSGGWRVSEEGFFKPLKSTVSNLKFRGSWGQLGNQNIGANYPYIATVGTGQDYAFGGTVQGGIAQLNGSNPFVQWETTTDTDLGLDLGLFRDKLKITADYFIRNTTDILYAVVVSAPYGLKPPTQNTSSVQNKGWEFAVNYNDKKGDFTYGITANATFLKNEVIDLGPSSSPVVSAASILKPGLPMRAFWGYEATGIFQTQAQIDASPVLGSRARIAPGDLMYKDISGPTGKPDGIIDGNDKTYLGSNFPKITYGLNLDVSWKNFDLVCFFQGAAGYKNIISGPVLGQNGNAVGKPTSAMLDYWTPDNTNASFPRLWINYANNDPAKTPSSYWVRNAGYIRLKNLQVGYNLPAKWASKAKLQKLRIYYSGQNLFTSTSFYNWVDPEAPSQTIGSSYPQVKANTLGLNVTF